MSLIEVRSIEDLGEFMAEQQKSRQEQDLYVVPWQAAMKPGDKFVQFLSMNNAELTIYGEVLDPLEKPEPGVTLSDEEAMEISWENQRWAAPSMKYVRLARCYSTMCVGGELGHVHVATFLGHLSDAEFEQAKSKGWPHYRELTP